MGAAPALSERVTMRGKTTLSLALLATTLLSCRERPVPHGGAQAPPRAAATDTHASAPRVEAPPAPAAETASQTVMQHDGSYARLDSLEHELARAQPADSPALLLRLGIMKREVHGRRGGDGWAYAQQHPVDFGYDPHTPMEMAGLYKGGELKTLLARFPASPEAEPAAWAVAHLEQYVDCEGWVHCYLSAVFGPLSAYLRRFPAGAHAPQAVSRLNEAFAADTAHNTDLSEPGEFVDPDAIARVVAAYDTLAATLPQPLKDSAHAVVVEQWRRLRRSDSVGRRPQS